MWLQNGTKCFVSDDALSTLPERCKNPELPCYGLCRVNSFLSCDGKCENPLNNNLGRWQCDGICQDWAVPCHGQCHYPAYWVAKCNGVCEPYYLPTVYQCFDECLPSDRPCQGQCDDEITGWVFRVIVEIEMMSEKIEISNSWLG